jgi:uroporphyrin-III C-methyltransferase/precorrin-2 dehydrogenase/sirohydrochlorin ferrochelatase
VTTTAYLAGLRLHGRRVVVVGAGRVAERRLERLLGAGAEVMVIAPRASERISTLADQERLRWIQRAYAAGDLEGAWYVLAATDDRECNDRISAEAERQRIFCVRSDDRTLATAWTPAAADLEGVQIGVLAGGDPHRSRRIRDLLLRALTKIIRTDRGERAA